jgi:hypothetical protein
MKLKGLVFAFAAVLFISLSAQAATVLTCCGNPACCDAGQLLQIADNAYAHILFRVQFRERVWAGPGMTSQTLPASSTR